MNVSGELNSIRQAELYRNREIIYSDQSAFVTTEQNRVLNFCSNNYLGLANDERIKSAFIAAATKQGVGSGSSQLICGYHQLHADLEDAVSEFLGVEKAVLFSNGYLANLGLMQAYMNSNSLVCMDRLNHASLYDGIKLSSARLKRYPHCKPETLFDMLNEKDSQCETRFVVSDGVFSMDGDVAPIPALFSVAENLNANT